MIRYLFVGLLGAAAGAIATQALRPPVSATMKSNVAVDDSASAAAGVAALHHADSVATISGDPKELRELWDSAAVRMTPGGPPTVTRAAIFAADSASRANNPERHITQYAAHYPNLIVIGNMGVEWGYFDAQVVAKPGATPVSGRGNVLRVLRRQPNGEWKFSHVILNAAR